MGKGFAEVVPYNLPHQLTVENRIEKKLGVVLVIALSGCAND